MEAKAGETNTHPIGGTVLEMDEGFTQHDPGRT